MTYLYRCTLIDLLEQGLEECLDVPDRVHRWNLGGQLHALLDLTSLLIAEDQTHTVRLLATVDHGMDELEEVTLLNDKSLGLARL